MSGNNASQPCHHDPQLLAPRGRTGKETTHILQRKLNESVKKERRQLKALLQVNCVSHVDPITFRK